MLYMLFFRFLSKHAAISLQSLQGSWLHVERIPLTFLEHFLEVEHFLPNLIVCCFVVDAHFTVGSCVGATVCKQDEQYEEPVTRCNE